MRALTPTLILTVALTLAAPAAHAWEKVSDESGVTVFREAKSGSGTDRFRGVVVIEHPTDQVIDVLGDVKGYKHFMPDLASARLIERKRRDDGTVVSWVYQRLDLSAVDDRDFTVRAETSSMSSRKGKYWVTDFRATSKRGPKPKPGVVRIRKLTGQWLLEPLRDGKATRLTWTRHLELGGNVPDFLVNDGSEESIARTLIGLRARCAEVLR